MGDRSVGRANAVVLWLCLRAGGVTFALEGPGGCGFKDHGNLV